MALNLTPTTIMEMDRDEKTAEQLQRCLTVGAEAMLREDLERYLKQRSTRLFRSVLHASLASTRSRLAEGSGGPLQTTLTQIYNDEGEGGGGNGGGDGGAGGGETRRKKQRYVIRRSVSKGEEAALSEVLSEDTPAIDKPTTTASTGGSTGDDGNGSRSALFTFHVSPSNQTEVIIAIISYVAGSTKQFLDDTQPSFIVMYDPVIDCVRQVCLFPVFISSPASPLLLICSSFSFHVRLSLW